MLYALLVGGGTCINLLSAWGRARKDDEYTFYKWQRRASDMIASALWDIKE